MKIDSLCTGNNCDIKNTCARYQPTDRPTEQRVGTAMCISTHTKPTQYSRFIEKRNG